MSEETLKSRELDLRERSLAIEERKLRLSHPVLEWMRSAALLMASIAVPVLIFFGQQSQQAADRKLNNVREGYKIYFERITPIKIEIAEATDEDQRAALLDRAQDTFVTSVKIYPEVYCGARNDLVRFLGGVNTTDRTARLDAIYSPLVLEDAGAGQVLPAIRIPLVEPRVPDCKSQELSAHTGAPPVSVTPAPAPAAKKDSASTPLSAPSAPPPASAIAPQRTYRVFAQINAGRTSAEIDAIRAELEAQGFRFVRGVEVIGRPNPAEIRYFGGSSQQDADAFRLAEIMSEKFGVPFTTRAIGQRFPDLPPNNMEVWIPDPGVAAPVSMPPRRINP